MAVIALPMMQAAIMDGWVEAVAAASTSEPSPFDRAADYRAFGWSFQPQ